MWEMMKLLQQIANNTSHNSSLQIALIAGGSAILGSFVTAAFSYAVTRTTLKKQQQIEESRLRATIVTTERLRWLQDLRHRLANLYTQSDMQYNYLKRPIAQGQLVNRQKEFDDFSAIIMEEAHIIMLGLNPIDDNQADLRTSLNNNFAFLCHCFQSTSNNTPITAVDDKKYTLIKATAFGALTQIGVDTWKQIKELK